MKRLTPEHFIGCITGGAVGDALGAPTEFLTYNRILQKYGQEGVRDYVEFADGMGEITDDTQMLLFTVEGLLQSFGTHYNSAEAEKEYLNSIHQAYLRWLHTQEKPFSLQALEDMDHSSGLICEELMYKGRAPGLTCLSALRSGVVGTMQNPVNDSKGCGGIMRIAPVGLLHYETPTEAFRIGCELAAITHGHVSGYLSSGFLSALLGYIIQGDTLQEATTKTAAHLQEYSRHEETLKAVNNAVKLAENGAPAFAQVEKLGGGWVAEEALAISLYCAHSYPDNFEEAVILAVNHSGDTDSTGSITGNIMGLLLGEEAIPKRWRTNLRHYHSFRMAGEALWGAGRKKEEG
jgi:ADP-ribosyl-[dinitrogen reductase] hydrolase